MVCPTISWKLGSNDLMYTAATRAQWKPHKPWDLERHIVTSGEGVAAMVLLLLLLIAVWLSARLSLHKFPNTLLATINMFRLASNLSSMRLLTLDTGRPGSDMDMDTAILDEEPQYGQTAGNEILESFLGACNDLYVHIHVDSYFGLLRFDGGIGQGFRLLLHHLGREMGTTRLRPSASLHQRSGRSSRRCRTAKEEHDIEHF